MDLEQDHELIDRINDQTLFPQKDYPQRRQSWLLHFAYPPERKNTHGTRDARGEGKSKTGEPLLYEHLLDSSHLLEKKLLIGMTLREEKDSLKAVLSG